MLDLNALPLEKLAIEKHAKLASYAIPLSAVDVRHRQPAATEATPAPATLPTHRNRIGSNAIQVAGDIRRRVNVAALGE